MQRLWHARVTHHLYGVYGVFMEEDTSNKVVNLFKI